jgi:hypothetical protein
MTAEDRFPEVLRGLDPGEEGAVAAQATLLRATTATNIRCKIAEPRLLPEDVNGFELGEAGADDAVMEN